MAAIRHTLHRDLFLPNDERLVGVAYVAKASKKKKTCFLCAVVSTEKPIHATIYQIKKSDKEGYKKKASWPLHSLKLVDGKDKEVETAEFELHFERPYKWVASNVQEKNNFINCIWKLCCHYLPRQKPNFINIPDNLLEEPMAQFGKPATNEASAEEVDIEDGEVYQPLTAREEADLEKLMEQCNFVVNNAEAFTEQLTKELASMDAANIHVIMSSEQKVQGLMNLLDATAEEALKVENYLTHYDSLLKNVREGMLRMEEKDTLIQIQNKNNLKLLEELEALVHQLDLPADMERILQEGELKSLTGIEECVKAATALQERMNTPLNSGLHKMVAVKEQLSHFELLRSRFSERLFQHLTNLFIHLGNDQSQNLTYYSEKLSLPSHAACHSELLPYSRLMHWLKSTDPHKFTQLVETYVSCLSKLYDREIKVFFEMARERISGKQEKDKKGTLNWSAVASSTPDLAKLVSKPRLPALLGTETDYGPEDISERENFDKNFEQVLSALEPVCMDEQKFCIEFFGLSREISSSLSFTSQLSVGQISYISPAMSTASVNLSAANSEEMLSQKKDSKSSSEELRKMMSALFSVLEPELTSFINAYDKIDGFFSMYVLVRLSQHVMAAHDTGSFLSITFGTALVQAKRNFDKFMQSQIRSIEEAKMPKKAKSGILPFVSGFENFATQAENIFKGSDRHTDLDRWYAKLVRSMFEAIVRIAAESHKTPQEVVLMENFHHVYTLLYQLKIGCLESERKEAKQKYSEALQSYVTHYFGRPLEKLNLFFEGVQQKVGQGVKEEEISYQLAFSKQELRKVIREYPSKEVKKGLEALYRKVEKHLCEEENLLQVVWHSMQDEFIRQYKAIETLINRCYPGSMIALEFSIVDILSFFSEIAQQH